MLEIIWKIFLNLTLKIIKKAKPHLSTGTKVVYTHFYILSSAVTVL